MIDPSLIKTCLEKTVYVITQSFLVYPMVAS